MGATVAPLSSPPLFRGAPRYARWSRRTRAFGPSWAEADRPWTAATPSARVGTRTASGIAPGADASIRRSGKSLTESVDTTGGPSNSEVDHARPSSDDRISASNAPPPQIQIARGKVRPRRTSTSRTSSASSHAIANAFDASRSGRRTSARGGPSGANAGQAADLQEVFERFYHGERFVDVMPKGSAPETRSVRASNMVRIAVHKPQPDTVLVLVVEDNLCKGASGQAVQCMNLMFGFEEHLGLDLVPVLP